MTEIRVKHVCIKDTVQLLIQLIKKTTVSRICNVRCVLVIFLFR